MAQKQKKKSCSNCVNNKKILKQMSQKHRSHSLWSQEEDKLLAQHIQKGAAWIHKRLPWRSIKAIRLRAWRRGLSWKEPGRIDDLCPLCYTYRITRGSHAARYGICTVCYLKEEKRRFTQKLEEGQAKAEKEAARQRYYRSRRDHA